MADSRSRSLASTLLIGLLAGAGIVQLLPDPALQPAIAPPDPIVAIDQPAATEPARRSRPDTTAAPPPAAGFDGAAFVTRDQLESEIPPSVVELLIDRHAILVEASDAS